MNNCVYHATFGIPFRREGVSKAVEGKADVDDAELRQQRRGTCVRVGCFDLVPISLCALSHHHRPNPHLDRQRRGGLADCAPAS